MKFYKVSMDNSWCGFEEKFVTKSERELTFDDCVEMYSYAGGGAGLDPHDEDGEYESYDEYLEDIASFSDWEEISEEEFNSLIEEEGWEER